MSEYTSDAQSNAKLPRRDKLYTRWGQLKSERATWWAHWQELSTYILPRNGRFFVQNRDKGWRMHNNIYDSTGTKSLRVLGAGMMAVRDKTNELYYDVATQIDQFKSANMPRVGVSNAEVEVVPTLGVGIQEATTANP